MTAVCSGANSTAPPHGPPRERVGDRGKHTLCDRGTLGEGTDIERKEKRKEQLYIGPVP